MSKDIGKHARHGLSKTRTYYIWASMVQRCTRAENLDYERYGGHGIRVCNRWLIFKNFLDDMGPKPPGKSLDRIENSKNYEPSNCRWATPEEQNSNRSDNRFLQLNGESLTIAEWARKTGISKSMIRARVEKMGWAIEKALMTPIGATGAGRPRTISHEAICRLRDKGLSIRAIAKEMKCSTGSVEYALIERKPSAGTRTASGRRRRT